MIIALPLIFLRILHGRFGRTAGFRRHRDSREGEVTVSGEDVTAGEKIIGDNIGEYVEYEEVDDKKK